MMARIPHIKGQLENWARWHASGRMHGVGYPRENILSRMSPPSGRNEPSLPLLELDARNLEDIIQSIRLSHSHIHLLLTLMYAKGLPMHIVCKRMSKAQPTVYSMLGQADRLLDSMLEAQRYAKEQTKRAHASVAAR